VSSIINSQFIASYQLLAHIASGGQATVYRARHTVLQREVALKVLHPHLLTAPDFVEKFAREAQLLAQLKHPNIVEVYDANRDAATGLYFIAIEFLPGTDLETLIAQQGKLAVEVVVAVAQQVASALEYAHARNLIHRDIKPSNLMLLPDGTVKVLDFGIAAIIAAGQKARTRIGTVEYMAPEHFAGSADARSDIYSLGATLYHCLTGQLPPVIAVQPPTPPRQLNPAISPALENVILKALQADPARRQQTAREFIIEIESAWRTPPVAVSAPAAMACPHCGAANRVGAHYCATCGGAMIIAPKTYAGPLKVRMASQPLTVSTDWQPQFCWSPDSERLLVITPSDKTADASIFVRGVIESQIDGIRHKVKLGDAIITIGDFAPGSEPNWSPDSKEIAYTFAKDGKIWAFDIVNHNSRQLTYGDGVHTDPQWSPDGEYLGYAIERQTQVPPYIIQYGVPKTTIADWGKEWRITNLRGNEYHLGAGPCCGWSPSGLRFACIDIDAQLFSVFEKDSIVKFGIPKVDLRAIHQIEWVSDNHVAISWTWTRTELQIEKEFGYYETFLFNVETRMRHQRWLPVTHFAVSKSVPARVVGERRDFDFATPLATLLFRDYLVWTDPTQTSFRRLLSTLTETPQTDRIHSMGPSLEVHDWSPDATKILFTRSNGIYVVNIDDTGLQHLADGYAPKWSPDGKYIAFLRSPQEKVYEVWVMEVS